MEDFWLSDLVLIVEVGFFRMVRANVSRIGVKNHVVVLLTRQDYDLHIVFARNWHCQQIIVAKAKSTRDRDQPEIRPLNSGLWDCRID